MLTLTSENYYSKEANEQYLSVSQYKSFLSCEARALAELRGEYEQPTSEAFLVGQYVHSWAEGKLDEFIFNHPEIISSKGPTKGELKKDYKIANMMIETLKNDLKVMFYLQGMSEVPLIVTIGGALWKGKADKINSELNYILDLKTTKSITEFSWSQKHKKYVSFIEQYDYFTQVAVYSELDRQMCNTENYKDFVMAVVSKQDPPDHALIDLTDFDRVKHELEIIEENVPRIVAIKKGEIEPEHCGVCPYCRKVKKVDRLLFYNDLREV